MALGPSRSGGPGAAAEASSGSGGAGAAAEASSGSESGGAGAAGAGALVDPSNEKATGFAARCTTREYHLRHLKAWLENERLGDDVVVKHE